MPKPAPKRRWPAKPPRKPDHFGTIGEVIHRRDHIEIYCLRHGCHHHAPVNLEALRSEYGEDYSVSDFIARSRCSKCSARYPDIAITVTPVSTRGMRMGYTPGDDASPKPATAPAEPDRKQ